MQPYTTQHLMEPALEPLATTTFTLELHEAQRNWERTILAIFIWSLSSRVQSRSAALLRIVVHEINHSCRFDYIHKEKQRNVKARAFEM